MKHTSRGRSRSAGSGRKLTVEHIAKISRRLKISADLFVKDVGSLGDQSQRRTRWQ